MQATARTTSDTKSEDIRQAEAVIATLRSSFTGLLNSLPIGHIETAEERIDGKLVTVDRAVDVSSESYGDLLAGHQAASYASDVHAKQIVQGCLQLLDVVNELKMASLLYDSAALESELETEVAQLDDTKQTN